MIEKHIKLPNGTQRKIYDYTINSTTCMFSFINNKLEDIKQFFGKEIIDYVDILDEKKNTTESFDIYSKYDHSLVLDTIIQEMSYRVVHEAYDETIPEIVDEETGEVIQEEQVIHHEEVVEPIYTDVEVEMIQVFLEKPNIKDEINSIKKAVGIVNTNNMTVDEFKKYYIALSKTKLAEYLIENPLVSTCHGGVEGTYGITLDKQSLMMSNYMTYMIKKQMNPTKAILTWNESGDVCEIWTEEEFLQLISETEEIVKPLVTKQQSLEKDIMACTAIDSIKAISLDYSIADVRKQVVE